MQHQKLAASENRRIRDRIGVEVGDGDCCGRCRQSICGVECETIAAAAEYADHTRVVCCIAYQQRLAGNRCAWPPGGKRGNGSRKSEIKRLRLKASLTIAEQNVEQ